jgi:hypothetical protein
MPTLKGRCLNSEFRCNWPDEKKEQPKHDALPPNCFARCNKGHPVYGKVTRTKMIAKTLFATEVTYRCKICGTECVVSARGAETRVVPQREFIFEMFDEHPELVEQIATEEAS